MPPDALPVSREEIDAFIREKGVTKVARGVSGLVDEHGNWIGGSFYKRQGGRPKKAPPPAPKADPGPERVHASRAHAEKFAAAIEGTRKTTPQKPTAARTAPSPKPAPEATAKGDPTVDKCACGRWKSKRAPRCKSCTMQNPERRERYRQLVAEGKTAAEIAATLGVSRKGVYITLRRLGLKAKPAERTTPQPTGPTEQTRAYAEKIREMVAAEWKTSAIGEALGISQSRVYQIANAFGIDTNRMGLGQKPDEAKRQRYRDLHAKGLTSREIAAELGVSKRSVTAMLAKLGLPRNDPPGQAPFASAAPQIDPAAVQAAVKELDRAPASVSLSDAVIRARGILEQALREAGHAP